MMMTRDEFADFRAAVATHFAPVASALALNQRTEEVLYPEIYIRFAAPNGVSLCVAHELESGPWAYVTVFTGAKQHEFGLHVLVHDAEGSTAPMQQLMGRGTVANDVAALAVLTERYASSILRGDMSRIEILRHLRAKLHRERNMKLTGTATGGMRIEPRPTLEQLFARAQEAEFPADVRMISIYEAVWDYDYPVEEVARFLGLEVGPAQRIVDILDDVADDSVTWEELRTLIATRAEKRIT